MFQADYGVDEYKRTTEPIVVGASVLAMKYKDGVLIMSDTAAFYGSLARHLDVERIVKVNDSTVVAHSGELSDWQYLERLLQDLVVEDESYTDDISLQPSQIHSYITRVLHTYRNKADPLYNQIVVAGVNQDGTPYLGYSDLYGTSFEDDVVVTGFGLHMALPLLRKAYRQDMTYDEAKQVLEDAMRVLIYRHCRTINKVYLASFTQEDQLKVSEPYELATKWKHFK